MKYVGKYFRAITILFAAAVVTACSGSNYNPKFQAVADYLMIDRYGIMEISEIREVKALDRTNKDQHNVKAMLILELTDDSSSLSNYEDAMAFVYKFGSKRIGDNGDTVYTDENMEGYDADLLGDVDFRGRASALRSLVMAFIKSDFKKGSMIEVESYIRLSQDSNGKWILNAIELNQYEINPYTPKAQ